MSDVLPEEIHPDPEGVAEDQAWAEYDAKDYRAVPKPDWWWNAQAGDARHWWQQGVDAALTLHSDTIKRCNEALQQATGGHPEPDPVPRPMRVMAAPTVGAELMYGADGEARLGDRFGRVGPEIRLATVLATSPELGRGVVAVHWDDAPKSSVHFYPADSLWLVTEGVNGITTSMEHPR